MATADRASLSLASPTPQEVDEEPVGVEAGAGGMAPEASQAAAAVPLQHAAPAPATLRSGAITSLFQSIAQAWSAALAKESQGNQEAGEWVTGLRRKAAFHEDCSERWSTACPPLSCEPQVQRQRGRGCLHGQQPPQRTPARASPAPTRWRCARASLHLLLRFSATARPHAQVELTLTRRSLRETQKERDMLKTHVQMLQKQAALTRS
ncbi:MAG: hypothetical protein SGPRY_000274 [Prymnesium sp.]